MSVVVAKQSNRAIRAAFTQDQGRYKYRSGVQKSQHQQQKRHRNPKMRFTNIGWDLPRYASDRVTRLGKFLPLVDCFLQGDFFEKY
jgi:hypothetical protein